VPPKTAFQQASPIPEEGNLKNVAIHCVDDEIIGRLKRRKTMQAATFLKVVFQVRVAYR
jgi:hypothetical protein